MIQTCSLVKSTPSAAIFKTGGELLRIEAVSETILRVSFTGREEFLLQDNGMIEPLEPAALNIARTRDGYLLDAGDIQVRVAEKGGALSYYHGDELLTQEPRLKGRQLRPKEIYVNDFKPDAELTETLSVDGIRIRAKGTPRLSRQGYSALLRFEFQQGEAVYGLGQHEEGVLNYRGQHQLLYQHNLKVSCPVLMSSRGWGMLVNCQSAMTFHDDSMGSYFSMDTVDELDYFVGYGPELDNLVAMMRRLTGPARLLPRWAFGYLQSKEHYHTQRELVEVAREYRRREIPLDCVIQDWHTWPEGQWGQKTVDASRYPDLDAAMDQLHGMNVHVLWSVWPNMNGNGANRREFEEKGLLLGNRSTYNAFDEQARAIYWRQLKEGLFCHGIDGWWCDCTEPFERDWYGPVCFPPEERMAVNLDEFKEYLDPARINAYSLFHSRGIYQHQRAETQEKRVINLTRSGFPGQQKYATITWNGDTSARWDVLGKSIADGLNFCLSGQPYWSQDIGGFFLKRGREWFRDSDYDQGVMDPGYRELYVRWMQLGCFLPMMRSHGTDTPREVWQFGEPGDEIYEALVKAIRLRYQLLPYIYTLAAQAALQNGTMMRMLAFDFRGDPAALDIKDQFMLGKGLMVCPVLFPTRFTEGGERVSNPPKFRRVYLPKGARWVDFWTHERHEGGQWIDCPVALDTIPLFVPEGSILPLGVPRRHANEQPNAPVTLRVYDGRDGVGEYYSDAGDGYGYEAGESYRADLKWNHFTGCLDISEAGDERFKPERFILERV